MLAIVAIAALTGTTIAQDSFNQPSAIGSYQSILSRAGYGNAMGSMTRNVGMDVGGMAQGAATYGMQQVQGAVTGVPMQSAPVMTHAAPAVGSAVVGAPMAGQVMSAPMAAPMSNAMPVTTGAPMMSAPMMSGGVDMGANCSTCTSASSLYGDMLGGSLGTPAYSAPMDASCAAPVNYATPVYSAPVYQSVVSAPVVGRQRSRSNYTVGLIGMFFQRDYEDNRYLGFNPAGDTLFTNDADEQTFDGYGLSLASRNCRGGGFEVVYWALNPGRVSAELTGANVSTVIQGLDQLYHNPSARDMYDIYANTTSQRIERDTDINNLEFNFLRNGGCFTTRRCRKGFYELIGGFRWFEFDEALNYSATIDQGVYPASPASFSYNVEARNRLIGLQLGARNELCLGSKLRLFSAVKGGLFNNNIRTIQNIVADDGTYAIVNSGAAAGRDFNYIDEKNDVAYLGELDFGILYHLSCRARLRLGYRVLGAGGIALAADQMPYLYNDVGELSNAKSNGNLLLNGGYYGVEFCF